MNPARSTTDAFLPRTALYEDMQKKNSARPIKYIDSCKKRGGQKSPHDVGRRDVFIWW
jgi:hypothetical protein